MRSLSVAAVGALLVLAAAGASATLVRSSASAADVPKFTSVWSTSIGGSPGGATLDAAGTRLYLGANDGFAYAFDAYGGGQAWRQALPSATSCAPLVIEAQNAVLFIPENGNATVLSTASGAVVASFNLNAQGAIQGCQPVFDANTNMAFFSSRINSIFTLAINVTTWSVAWSATGASTPRVYPAGSGNSIVWVGSENGYLFSYWATNGTAVSTYSGEGVNYHRPVVREDVALFTARDGLHVVNLPASSDSPITEAGGTTASDVVLTPGQDTAIFGTDGGAIVAVRPFLPRAPMLRFNTTGFSPVATTPTMSGGIAYFGTQDGCIYAVAGLTFASGDGEPTLVAFVNLTAPVAPYFALPMSTAYGVIYAATADGTISALSVGGATLPPSPPTPAPSNAIVANYCDGPACTQCRQVGLDAGCVQTSISTSLMRACGPVGLTVTQYPQGTACSGTEGQQEVFALGACYGRADGSTFSILSCATSSSAPL